MFPLLESFIKIDVDYFSVLAFCRVDIHCSCVFLLSEFQRTVKKVVQKTNNKCVQYINFFSLFYTLKDK